MLLPSIMSLSFRILPVYVWVSCWFLGFLPDSENMLVGRLVVGVMIGAHTHTHTHTCMIPGDKLSGVNSNLTPTVPRTDTGSNTTLSRMNCNMDKWPFAVYHNSHISLHQISLILAHINMNAYKIPLDLGWNDHRSFLRSIFMHYTICYPDRFLSITEAVVNYQTCSLCCHAQI